MFRLGTEEYYQKFIELQEKLRKSEEERLKLEMKFNEMMQVSREEEQSYYKRLRSQYKRFLEENRSRQERNERILRLLERVEGRAAMIEAKTERFQMLRNQYRSYLDRVVSKKAITPKETKNLDNERKSGEVIERYLHGLHPRDTQTDIADEILKSIHERNSCRLEKKAYGYDDFGRKVHFDGESSLEDDEQSGSERIRPNTSSNICNKYSTGDEMYNSKLIGHTRVGGYGNEAVAGKVTSGFRNYQNEDNHIINGGENMYGGNVNQNILNGGCINGSSSFKNDTNQVAIGENNVRNSLDLNQSVIKDNRPNSFECDRSQSAIGDINGKTMDGRFKNDQTGGNNSSIIQNQISKDEEQNKYVDEMNSSIKPDCTKNVDFQGILYDKKNLHGNFEQNGSTLYDHRNGIQQEVTNNGMPVDEKQVAHNFDKNDLVIPPNANSGGNNLNDYNKTSITPEVGHININTAPSDQSNHFYKNQQLGRDINGRPLQNEQTPLGDNNGDVLQYEEGGKVVKREQSDNYGGIVIQDVVKDAEENINDLKDGDANGHPSTNFHKNAQQDIQYDSNDGPIGQITHDNTQYDKNDNVAQKNYDQNSQPFCTENVQYDENGQPLHTENGQAINSENDIVHDAPQQNIQHAEYDQPINYERSEQNIEYEENGQPIVYHTEKIQHGKNGQLNYETTGQINENCKNNESQNQQYDEYGLSQNQEYNEHGINNNLQGEPIKKGNDENVQPAQFDENGLPISYDTSGQSESGQLIQYDENGQVIQCDENGQVVDENSQAIQYDQNGQAIQYGANGQTIGYDEGSHVQYDANGQAIQYDENGQAIQYDESGQPIYPEANTSSSQFRTPTYDENGQIINYDPQEDIQYDENGQAFNYEQSVQYDKNGQPIQYDENGQPIQYDPQGYQYDENGQIVQYDENGQPIQYGNYGEGAVQYDEQGYAVDGAQQPVQYDENGQVVGYEGYQQNQYDDSEQGKQADLSTADSNAETSKYEQDSSQLTFGETVPQTGDEKKANVLDLLETDTESAKQDTHKASNDSDFDFSNA